MDKLSIEEVINCIDGDILSHGKICSYINNVSTDSRSIQPGELFIPLVGDKFDGHNFIADVIHKGITSIIIDESLWESIKPKLDFFDQLWIIAVEDTLAAYQALARHYLKKLKLCKIAITGSNGKTSTKEMIKAILSTHYRVSANEGNFNNQIGVPKTVFSIDPKSDVALIEMGTGKIDDIKRLSCIVEPDIGIITNIGMAHTEFLGGQDGVAKEKRNLFTSFHESSTAILNEDDLYFDFLKENLGSKLRSFSVHRNSPLKVLENLGLNGYRLEFAGAECLFSLGGEHNLVNLHFAVVLADILKVPDEKVRQGIASIKPVKMRVETSQGKFTIIKDCYNANPSSMKAGLDFFNSLSTKGKKICVLGDMLELGQETEKLHEDIGRYFSKLNIDYLFTLGKLGKKIAAGALESKALRNDVISSDSQETLLESINNVLRPDDMLYFKASRGMELEKLALAIEKLN